MGSEIALPSALKYFNAKKRLYDAMKKMSHYYELLYDATRTSVVKPFPTLSGTNSQKGQVEVLQAPAPECSTHESLPPNMHEPSLAASYKVNVRDPDRICAEVVTPGHNHVDFTAGSG